MTAAPLPAPLPCPFCGAPMVPQDGWELVGIELFVHSDPPSGDREPCIHSDTLLDLDEIAAWNRRAPEAQAWRDISTAPRDGTVILLLRDATVVPGVWRGDEPLGASFPWIFLDYGVVDAREDAEGYGMLNAFHGAGEYAPTHWQPLPAPPGATPAAPPAREAALAEALRECAEILDKKVCFEENGEPIYYNALTKARAALAEAEGRE